MSRWVRTTSSGPRSSTTRCWPPANVDRIYRKALELGATDEGPSGPRGEGFYAGYFRDPDGNKLSVFCFG